MAHRFLTSPSYDGYFDFFTLAIVLTKYVKDHAATIQRALAWRPSDPSTPHELDIRALLAHEATHFLDMTTTNWGRQYVFRKLRFLSLIDTPGAKRNEAEKVFMIDTGEIDVHDHLLETGEIRPSACGTLRHGIVYTEKFGAVLLVKYFSAVQAVHTVPLSMISLLEANASASEFLCRIHYMESLLEPAERMLTLQDIEQEFGDLLDDPKRLEYSVLLRLTRDAFPMWELKNVLQLVAALSRFSLDLPDLAMAIVANDVERSITKSFYANAIANELRRGQHRQMVFFKTLMFINDFLTQMSEEMAVAYDLELREAPRQAIRRVWIEGLGVKESNLDLMREHQGALQLRMIEEIGLLEDGRIIRESGDANSALLDTASAGSLALSQLRLPNFYLADNTELAFPNAMDLRIVDYVDENIEKFAKLTGAYRAQTPGRIHMPPDTVQFMIK